MAKETPNAEVLAQESDAPIIWIGLVIGMIAYTLYRISGGG